MNYDDLTNEQLWAEWFRSREPRLRELLFARVHPLLYKRAIYVSKKLWPNEMVTIDDLLSVGTLEVLRSFEHFDPSRGRKLTTYAVGNAEWQMKSARLDLHPLRRCEREGPNKIAVRVGHLQGEEKAIDLPDYREPIDRQERGREEFERLIAPLDARTRRVFRMRFVDLATLEEIGTAIGVTRERVRQILERTMATMKPQLEQST